MPEYYIEWRIEIDAESPEKAARKALAIQRDPNSLATVFHVVSADTDGETYEFEPIDLTEIDNDR